MPKSLSSSITLDSFLWPTWDVAYALHIAGSQEHVSTYNEEKNYYLKEQLCSGEDTQHETEITENRQKIQDCMLYPLDYFSIPDKTKVVIISVVTVSFLHSHWAFDVKSLLAPPRLFYLEGCSRESHGVSGEGLLHLFSRDSDSFDQLGVSAAWKMKERTMSV